MTNDIASELAKLHELTGADFSRQVERIALMKVFHPLDNEKGVYTPGDLQNDDYQNQLVAARKAVEFGYKVYIMPTPKGSRTPDFILEKKNTYRVYDLKTIFGKSSVGQDLIDSIGQCNRILLNMISEYNTRSLAFDIKRYFETNDNASEVLIFKGRKRISINRMMINDGAFLHKFKRIYEK
jgi:hypothetical protein